MIRNPQIKGAPQRANKKKKGQPKEFTTNMTVAMGQELLDRGGPVAHFGEARAIATVLLKDGPEGTISELPITRRYVTTLTSRAWDMGRLSPRLERAMLDEVVMSLAEAILFSTRFVEYGRPIFKLSAALVTSLALTEYDGDMDEVRLPFPSIKIKLDPGSGLYLTGDDGVEDPIKEIEVLEWGGSNDVMSYYVIASKTFIDPPIAWEKGIQTAGINEDSRNMFGEKVSEHSRYTVTELIPNLITSFCLYVQMKMEHKEVGIRPGPKQRRPNASGDTVYPLGKEIKLPAQLRSVYEMGVGGDDDEERWKIRNRFMVRGHWRNQAHGPGRSLRTRKWIQPFWKGPTTGEELARIYGVE